MDVDKIKMPQEVAAEEWKKYNALLKKRKDKYLEDMKKAMYQLKQGKELIDIYVVMEKAGLNKEQQPRLALCRADWKNVFFVKKDEGRGIFTGVENREWTHNPDGDIDLQPKTFMQWNREKYDINLKNGGVAKADHTWRIANKRLQTRVPIIPIHLEPEDDLKNYYILWEVESWQDVPPARDDPILLKRITENLFVILGAWEVTDLEQSIIRGL